jgi:hypothetical protein
MYRHGMVLRKRMVVVGQHEAVGVGWVVARVDLARHGRAVLVCHGSHRCIPAAFGGLGVAWQGRGCLGGDGYGGRGKTGFRIDSFGVER